MRFSMAHNAGLGACLAVQQGAFDDAGRSSAAPRSSPRAYPVWRPRAVSPLLRLNQALVTPTEGVQGLGSLPTDRGHKRFPLAGAGRPGRREGRSIDAGNEISRDKKDVAMNCSPVFLAAGRSGIGSLPGGGGRRPAGPGPWGA
jgi:hypothetical protein